MKKISIAYMSPSWPLSHHPNGIVSYLENLLFGFECEVDPYIFSHNVAPKILDKNIIDLSQFDKSVYERLMDKFFYSLNILHTEELLYKKHVMKNTESFMRGVNSLSVKFDLLELEESFGLADSMSKMTSIPIVTRLHCPWFIIGQLSEKKTDNYEIRIRKERLAMQASQGLSSPSQDVLDKTCEYYNLLLPNAKVIPNPIAPVPTDKHWDYEMAVINPSILFIGRFDSIKGADIAIAAFRLVALQYKDIELVFVGPDSGMVIKGKKYFFMDFLEQFIPEITVKRRIKFLGHCTAQQISEYRKQSLITIVTSRYENFPMSLLEALATGCPTVGVSVGGIKEIIIDEYNGLLAEPESPESIAEKLETLLSDHAKMRVFSKNAITDTQERFSPKIVSKQTLDFYKSVIAN